MGNAVLRPDVSTSAVVSALNSAVTVCHCARGPGVSRARGPGVSRARGPGV